jgi:hypothetical protein
MPTELRWCPSCRDERPFETPHCLDGHGADCPDRACVGCGTAAFVGPLCTAQPPAPLPMSTAA